MIDEWNKAERSQSFCHTHQTIKPPSLYPLKDEVFRVKSKYHWAHKSSTLKSVSKTLCLKRKLEIHVLINNLLYMCTFQEFFLSFTICCRRRTSQSSFHLLPSLERKEIFTSLSTTNTSKLNTYCCMHSTTMWMFRVINLLSNNSGFGLNPNQMYTTTSAKISWLLKHKIKVVNLLEILPHDTLSPICQFLYHP